MTLAAIGSLTALGQKPDALAAADTAAPQKPELQGTPEQRKVARDFEAIFIRQLLSGLEKGGALSGASSTGASMYKSMLVGSLADTAAEGGGIGLADVILQALLGPASPSTRAALTQPGAVSHDATAEIPPNAGVTSTPWATLPRSAAPALTVLPEEPSLLPLRSAADGGSRRQPR